MGGRAEDKCGVVYEEDRSKSKKNSGTVINIQKHHIQENGNERQWWHNSDNHNSSIDCNNNCNCNNNNNGTIEEPFGRTQRTQNSKKSTHKQNTEVFLKNRISEIALMYPFYEYRRICALIRKEGILVNHKKVYRIYRDLNLQRPRKKKKLRRNLIASLPSLNLVRAFRPNEVWVTDFVSDTLLNSKHLRILIIQDAYTKKIIGYGIHRSITAEDVKTAFERAIRLNGKPDIIRSDNGPEFRSKLLNSFLNTNKIKHEFIEKGKPYQNGIVRSFMDKLRDECLNLHTFKSIEEAKEIIANYIDFYNRKRPHSSLNYRTPVEFERSLAII